MKIAICDDEAKDIKRLRDLIEKYGEDNRLDFFITEFKSGKELIKDIKMGDRPEIIFLDINMEGMDGLTVAKSVREEMEDVPIILVTAYMNYALEGYKVRASRFLVKDELDKTIGEALDDICREIRRKTKKILLSCVEGDTRFNVSDIILIETCAHRNDIHAVDKQYHIYETMDSLEEKLRGYGFLRVHRSYLVNMQHIQSIGSYKISMDNGETVPVPRARYTEIKREYLIFAGMEL